uniref:Cytochrome P450 33 n=1 Tax=Streltzoviella insularis TaxID=1206366 RepID=A0A7D5YKC6_9NEOP|nr:cytochrome P450 33 [Streltzoviella insularis]
MILFIIALVFIVVILNSWLNLIKDNKKTNIRGPFPLPIVGNGHLFLGNSSDFLKRLSQLTLRYGDIVRAHILSRRYVILSHPKYIEGIVSSTEMITKGNSYTFLQPWLGQGLLTASGNRWRTHRKFLTPAFHYNILQTFLPVFLKNEKILRRKLRNLADGRPIDLFPIIALAALDNVAETIMGVSFNAQNHSESKYVKAIEILSEIVSLRMRNPFVTADVIFNLLPYKNKQEKALKILHEHTRNVMEIRRQDLKKLNITNLSDSTDLGLKNKHAFLDLLLLSELDGQKFDDESIREEVDTFMFEGHDTTTSGIVYCLYSISKNMDVQQKILDEQMKILNSDLEKDPTYTELQQMKYLELVIKESLRLYPSVPLIERAVNKNIEIAGYNILRDTSVIINIIQMQRNPDVYECPLEFRPERFETSNLKNPYSWLAFSAGPRNCIGQKFAMLEMKVLLSAIVRHFNILPSGKEPELCGDLILRSTNGVFIKLSPRV